MSGSPLSFIRAAPDGKHRDFQLSSSARSHRFYSLSPDTLWRDKLCALSIRLVDMSILYSLGENLTVLRWFVERCGVRFLPMVEMTAGALVALTQPAFRGGSVTGNADTPLAHPYFPACSSKLPLLPIYFFSFARAFYKLSLGL